MSYNKNKNEKYMKNKTETIFFPNLENNCETPFFAAPIVAGLPSPADDFLERSLDLNKYLIKHPAATFFVKVQGSSMKDANIFEGDILVIDRSIKPKDHTIIIAAINGEFTVKRLRINKDKISLEAANKSFLPIEINPEADFEIWGVVTYIIHKAR
jgi:DNA polymerase V